MPYYFMRDTPLQALEQLMMSQPGQKPRGGGIYRSPFRYTPEDVACEYCQNYVRKHPCRLCECTCLEERIEAGVLELNAFMWDCFTPSMGPQFRKRMHQQFRERKPQFFQFFLSDAHRRRWTHWRERCWRLSDRNKAALFLLTAYESLWRRMVWKCGNDGFDFQSVRLGGIEPELYSVYQAAKAIAVGCCNITLADLASPELVTDEAFHLITGALGDGQHGTARWATDAEIRKAYALVPFQAASWRRGQRRPEVQGLVLGSISHKRGITALVDKDDVHCLMIGASGVGKTAYFLYPNLEYACASGMSFLALDTKGDLARNYGAIAEKYYGYHVSVVDLRNPTRSDGYNLMTLINHYMDAAQATGSLAARAKAEKYAKILAKTIVSPNGDTDYGQNAYFYDAAEGLLTSVVLLLAEFLPPDGKQERRHIVSVFKLVQELLAPSGVRGKNWFTILMEKLPPEHKARWFAGAALNTSDQAMASVMSTVLSRLNAFLDSELEQVLCFDSTMNAERFAAEKSAIFLILPEEDQTKNFMAGLMIQTLARELFAVADENGGRLPGRVVFFCDELGTMPAFDILPLFSAGRSRGLTMVPIIQALAQLEKNYGREGAEILTDNCQDTIFGGFAPNSQTAEKLSKALGSRTVLSGSISRSKNDPSQSLQMMERPLMTPDELKSIPKGSFVVMKTGTHPMQTKLRLFLDWGITFGAPYITPEHAARPVAYASRQELFLRIDQAYGKKNSQPTQVPVAERRSPYSAMGLYNEDAKT